MLGFGSLELSYHNQQTSVLESFYLYWSLLQQLTAQHSDYLTGWTRLWSMQLGELGRRSSLSPVMNRGDITPLLPQIEANRFRFMGSMADMGSLASFLARSGEAGQPLAAELWLAIAERYPGHPRAEIALVTAARYVDSDAGLEILGRLLELYPESPLRYRARWSRSSTQSSRCGRSFRRPIG